MSPVDAEGREPGAAGYSGPAHAGKGKMWKGHPKWMWYTLAGASVVAVWFVVKSRGSATPTQAADAASVDAQAPSDSGSLPDGSYDPGGAGSGNSGVGSGAGYADPGIGGSSAIADPGLSSANTPEPVDNGPSSVTINIEAAHAATVDKSHKKAQAAKKPHSEPSRGGHAGAPQKVVSTPKGAHAAKRTPAKPPAKKPVNQATPIKKPAKPIVGSRGHKT